MSRPEVAPTDKRTTIDEALSCVRDGDTIMIGGFGDAGRPDGLVERLRASGHRALTIVSNNAGHGGQSLGGLIADGSVARLVCSFPSERGGGGAFNRMLEEGAIGMELLPQGVLTERLRAGASGVVAFYLPAPTGTAFEDVSRVSHIDGVRVQRYDALRGDVALVRGAQADRLGNVRCRLAARNFNPVMARAARVTIVQADEVVGPGSIEPDLVHIPGVVVDYVVPCPEWEGRA